MYLSQMNLIGSTPNGSTLNGPTQSGPFSPLLVRENHRNVSKTNERVDKECDSWDKNNGKLLRMGERQG